MGGWKLQLIVVIASLLLLCDQCSNAAPLDTPSSKGEDMKVPQLRQKLERLHSILMKDLEIRKEKPSENLHQHTVEKQTGHESVDNNEGGLKNSHKKQQQQSSLDEEQHKVQHRRVQTILPKLRAVKSEDMSREKARRDNDEVDLDKLSTGVGVKDKREQDESIQILAKALAQINNRQPQNEVKASETADAVKEQQNDNDLEALIEEALTRLDQGEKSKVKHGHAGGGQVGNGLPLFHSDNSNDVGDTSKIPPIHKENSDSNKLNGKKSAPHSQTTVDVNDNDNDDDDNDSITEDELMKALYEAGYFAGDSEDRHHYRETPSKSKVLENVEERLVEDIDRANSLGVSVNDLIQDLEDKAFKEAVIRQLQRLGRTP